MKEILRNWPLSCAVMHHVLTMTNRFAMRNVTTIVIRGLMDLTSLVNLWKLVQTQKTGGNWFKQNLVKRLSLAN